MDSKEKEQQFLNLMEEHKDQVYRICWGFSKRVAEVEDLFQEVMLRLWKNMGGFRGEAQRSTWVYRITVNTCIYWKKKHQSKNWEDLAASPEIETQGNAETMMLLNERVLQLKAAIQQLNKLDKTIALLLLEELSYKEIAAITGLPVNNVGVKINRIKSKLKKMLQK
ncbi:MAG: RNA polymerase sigma factor [Saprospiraceae bacterium]